jgi:N-acetylglucosaminyldiphosphoundecaprenol N-acetyl-beta-D-mannosaminyltransferase
MLRRICEYLLCLLAALCWLLPLAMIVFLLQLCRRRPWLERERAVATLSGGEMTLCYLASPWPLVRWSPLLLWVLAGKMSLCGWGLRKPGEALPAVGKDGPQRPAIFSPWLLHQATRMGITERESVEAAFCQQQSLRGDLSLLLRSLFALLFFSPLSAPLLSERLELFGVNFANSSLAEATAAILAAAQDKGGAHTVFFVNPHCFNLARVREDYRAALMQTEHIYPDGSGVVLACRMLNTPLQENVNGTDLFPRLCRAAQEQGRSLYLLGGRPGIAERVQERMIREFPGLRIVGTQHGYFDVATESAQVIAAINAAAPDILLVALGVPQQELWLTEHRAELRVPVRLAVGGLFDFYSGAMRRAPLWLREMGLEWVFRLLMEPRRMFRRYVIGNPLFLLAVWRYGRRRSKDVQPE